MKSSSGSRSIGSAIGRLHRDERGQIALLAVLAATAFACVLALVINTGHATSQKIELQNNADVSAFSGATWIARGLNVISMNNVTQTQLLALAILLPAIENATRVAAVICKAESAIPFIGWYFAAQAVYMEGVATALKSLEPWWRRPNGFLWSGMNLLSKLSDFTSKIIPIVAIAETNGIAVSNRADRGLLWPVGATSPGNAFKLPVRKGTFDDLCKAAEEGSPTTTERGYNQLYGYELGKGPVPVLGEAIIDTIFPVIYFKINLGFFSVDRIDPWVFSGIRPLAEWTTKAWYANICGGDPPEDLSYERPVSYEECKHANGTAAWRVDTSEAGSFMEPLPNPYALRPDQLRHKPPFSTKTTKCAAGPPAKGSIMLIPPPPNRPAEIGSDTPTPSPDGSGSKGAVVYRSYEQKPRTETVQVGTDLNGKPTTKQVTKYDYIVHDYWLTRSSVTETRRSNDLNIGSTGGSRPFPYLLDEKPGETREKFAKRLNYVAIVSRKDAPAWAAGLFVSPWGENRRAFAQAKVFNGTAFDLFTQDWRVKLAPVTLVGSEPWITNH